MRHRAGRYMTVAVLLVAASAAAADPKPLVKGPYIQNVQPTRVTIMWETADRTAGAVEYGPTEALGRVAKSTERERIHEVTVTDLKPRTAYHYRVRVGDATSPRAAFTTAFYGEGAFSFAAYGDTRSHPGQHARVARLIRNRRPDFVLHTGDLVASGADYDSWNEEFFEPAGDLMRSCCLWPALGNHDEDADWYYGFFSLPDPERWYTFRWGNARFISLDANRSLGADSRQIAWLQGVLAAKVERWTFVFLHYPAYSGGPHGGDPRLFDAFVPLIEKHGVDVVFAGHNHLYERSYRVRGGKRDAERGVLYITTAGGGAPLYTLRPEPVMAVAASRLHACFVRVSGSDVTIEARDPDGELIDALELTKDRARVDRLLKALDGPAPASAADELGRLEVTKAAPRLVALLDAKQAAARYAAARALARLNVPEGVAALAGHTRDRDARMRQFTARGLAASREKRHLAAVTAALGDADPAVAAEAARGLAWMGFRESTVPLLKQIKDPGRDLAVKQAAALALAELEHGRPDHVGDDVEHVEPLLVALLDSRDLTLAAEAAEGLEKHKTPTARAALCAALGRSYEGTHEHDEFDEDVLEALRKMGDRSCGEALLTYVTDRRRNRRNRRRAAKCFTRLTGVDLALGLIWSQEQVEAAVRRARAALKGAGNDDP